MSWARIDCTFPRHRKTLRLVRRLGPVAETYPPRLWLWAAEQSPHGSLQDLEPEELAVICGFDGDPGELWSALHDCGWIEPHDGSWRIHDWYDHNGIIAERRVRNAERMRRARAQHVGGTCGATNERTDDTNERDERTNGKKGARVPAHAAPEHEIPSRLNVPAFLKAWEDWHAYRRERRLQPWKPRTIAAKLAQMSEWGPTRAVAAIEHSIREGYQGIFESKNGAGSPAASTIPAGPRKVRKEDPGERRARVG